MRKHCLRQEPLSASLVPDTPLTCKGILASISTTSANSSDRRSFVSTHL